MRIIKIFALCLILFLAAAPSARPDWTYNEIANAIKKGTSYQQLRDLEMKFRRRVIGGEGYVLLIIPSETINGYDVHIIEEYNDETMTKIMGDVCVIIPEGSVYSEVVKKLRPGDKVSFSGSMSLIFGKTIFLKGSAKVEPAER